MLKINSVFDGVSYYLLFESECFCLKDKVLGTYSNKYGKWGEKVWSGVMSYLVYQEGGNATNTVSQF